MSSFLHSKKSLVALLVGAPLSLSLVACGSGESSEDSDASASESTVTSTTSAEEATEGSETEASENTDASEEGAANEGEDAEGDDAAGAEDGDEPSANTNNAGAAAGAGAGQNPYTGGRGASAPDVPANQSSGEPAAVADVEAAVQNQFDPAHYANMLTLWDHTQGATCASALQTSQQEAKDAMAQEMPAELRNVDVYALMEDPSIGPVIRDQLAGQAAPAAPQLNSINNVDVSGEQATVNVSTNEGEQDMNFVNEGGVWKVCG